MRTIVPIILAAVPTLASAQPQTRPSTCDVTIVRAPDDVRPIVQHWIDAEPRCRGSLEVRIIQTEGGYYLIARDERGHTNERIVPDAQSAGVLIASWAADDGSIGGTPAPIAAPTPAPAPMAEPTPAPMAAPIPVNEAPIAAPGMMAPGAPAMVERPLGVDAPPPSRLATAPRWLTLGALAGPNLGGVRIEADLKHGRWWTVGLAGSITSSQADLYSYTDGTSGKLQMLDAKGTAFAAVGFRSGRFDLRGSFGLGLAYTNVDAVWDSASYPSANGAGLFGIADLSLTAGYQLSETWGLAGGPIATLYDQNFNLTNTSNAPMSFSRGGDLAFFMAVRHRL